MNSPRAAIRVQVQAISKRQLKVALTLVICLAAFARDQNTPLPPAELMKQVVTNELADRVQHRKFLYLIDKRDGAKILTEKQVDTKDGPIYRVLAIAGKPLDPEQRQQDKKVQARCKS